MIVDPDFLDHWRTRMLVDMLEDELAPMYIIRLWGHCQNRREWIFDGMPVQATKAICRYQGDAEQFEKALIDCGFLTRKEDEITIVGWDEHNASLIANWTNGLRGGRPKGSTKETRKKPMGKPNENPADNPSGTDKIGLDKIGLDDINIVISYLNDAAGKNFRGAKADKAMIGQRLKDYGMDCVKSVIDKKSAKWKDDPKMRDYLRPSTLFRPSNFDAYVNEDQKPEALKPSSEPTPMHRREMPKPDRPPRREE